MKYDTCDFLIIMSLAIGFANGYWYGRWGRFFRKRYDSAARHQEEDT